MKTPKKKKKLDVEIIKTYDLCNKIICRPSQSRETIPLKSQFLFGLFGFSYIFESAEPVLKETNQKKNGFKVIKKHFKLLSNEMK